MLTTRPRGTNDILPGEVEKWHSLEKMLREVAGFYGYREVRTPIFEHTELFQRGVGETTDIVEKEMYTFVDRGERSLTLRPEGTAPTVRAFVENKMFADTLPAKLYYLGPMFRYDRPQAGRYRQFHQFGVEVFGSKDPSVDAEVIAMAMDIYGRLGLKNLLVELNSVGCPVCRPIHRQKLQEFLEPRKNELCPTCQSRYEKNPLRILDCKSPVCQSLVKEAPVIGECLCQDCRDHFTRVKEYLEAMGIEYRVNPTMVRGLDYYVMTAFEIVAQGIGAQSSIGGGGRYDGLVEQCGGPAMPGIGYALGLERILLTMKQQGCEKATEPQTDVYIATLGDAARLKGAVLAQNLRAQNLTVERDSLDKSLKAQLKTADRLKVGYTLILGEEELQKNEIIVRKMENNLAKDKETQMTLSINEIVPYLCKQLGGEDR